MSAEKTVSEARAELGPVTSRAAYAGETTYLTKHGHRVAAVVPAGAAQLLEDLEDMFDLQAVRTALEQLDAGTEDPTTLVRRTPRRRTA